MLRLARRWWPALVVAAAVAWQYRAPLLGRVYDFEDIAAYFIPLYAAAARAFAAGHLPIWDAGAWAGQPLVGDPQLGVFYPLNWLWLVLSPERMYAWLALVHGAIGAAGAWCCARARGRSRAAAAVAALALALGAFYVLELRHAMFIATTAWLPWALWGLERYAGAVAPGSEGRRRVYLGALAVALGLALLGGGWSMLFFGGWVLAVIGLGRVLAAPGRARLGLMVALGLAAVAGVALGAVALVPALAHARQSPRALGLSYRIAASYAWPSWRYLATLALPTLYGDDARGTYVGAPDQWELCGYGIGLAGALLALASLLWRERRGERVALLALTLVACDLARGEGGFLHHFLWRHSALYASLRCPARALYVWTVAAPLLAADGVDALAARLPARARGPAAVACVVAVALELTFVFRYENPSVALTPARDPAAVAWLRAHGGRYINDVHLPQPFHNSGLTWGLESAGGYSSLPIWRYLHYLWIANHGRVYPSPVLDHDLTAQGLWRFSSPLVDLLGVRWVLAPPERGADYAQLGWRRLAGDGSLHLWRNPRALPPAFVVYRATFVGGEGAAAAALADPGFHPERVAIVEADAATRALLAPLAAATTTEPPPLTPATRWERPTPASLRVTVDAAAGGIVVMSEPWYPGWRARRDGAEVPVLPVDLALRGVAVPAGHHVVELELTCPPLARGALASGLALAILVIYVAVPRRRRMI